MQNIVTKIASELSLQEFQVNNVRKLLFDEDCTIPFVARYRKEATGTLDEEKLRDIRDRYLYLDELETNKEKYLKVVEEHCQKNPNLKTSFDALKAKFMAAETKQQLEDLYLPFKPKRRTRAQIAREKGLEPLLTRILEGASDCTDLSAWAQEYVKAGDDIDPQLRVAAPADALKGAADIYAEQMAETPEIRAKVREISFATGLVESKKVETPSGASPEPAKGKGKKTDAQKYENYFEYSEPIAKAAAHRIMAVRRGEAEKVLRVAIVVDKEKIFGKITDFVAKPGATAVFNDWQQSVIQDAYNRLLGPSIETEIRLQLKQSAEQEAISVFSKNLESLLLSPPIPGKTVLGVDPGIRTGSKLAVVSETGQLLDHGTIYPDIKKLDSAKTVQAMDDMAALIKKHNAVCIALGNGTACRELGRIIAAMIKKHEIKDIKRVIVNESGASVYSADAIAREEFPDLDVTIRSAVSIARRLQDPLAELVKIDPRSIGVGQYQHDVNVHKLNKSLGEVVESCVNRVGVNVNTASYSLLSYVSGINKTVAKNIVKFRDENSKISSRDQLLEVDGLGPKVFQQAAGFLRVPGSENPLDNSSVHPETYEIVQKIAGDLGKSLSEIIGNGKLVNSIGLDAYVTESTGMPTLKDIASELVKPGRDPRDAGTHMVYSDDICEIEDLEKDMVLKGTVTNVTNFGAFVDIGVHQDGLVHISELADQFVDNPSKVVSVGQVIEVRVIDVDVQRKRISLSCKSPQAASSQGAGRGERSEGRGRGGQGAGRGGEGRRNDRGGASAKRGRGGRNSGGPVASSKPSKPSNPGGKSDNFTMDDLLAKFNKR